MKARPRGMPTAQPTMTGVLDLWSGVEVVLEGLKVKDATGGSVPDSVVTVVRTIVETPAEPELTLVWTEVTGVGVAEGEESLLLESELFEADAGELEEDGESDDGAGVDEGFELPLLAASPVMDARLGASDPVDDPTVAYAFPSCRLKKGRG